MGFLLFSGGMSTVPASVQAPAVPPVPAYSVTLTAYNAVPEQTDSDPFTTASGLYSYTEIIAARSRDMADRLPFGTVIAIEGPAKHGGTCGYNVVKKLVGYRIIADTMNARYTDRIDILFSTDANFTQVNGSQKNASHILGICNEATIRVVGFVDIKRSNKLPKTQEALVAFIEGSTPDIALK